MPRSACGACPAGAAFRHGLEWLRTHSVPQPQQFGKVFQRIPKNFSGKKICLRAEENMPVPLVKIRKK